MPFINIKMAKGRILEDKDIAYIWELIKRDFKERFIT